MVPASSHVSRSVLGYLRGLDARNPLTWLWVPHGDRHCVPSPGPPHPRQFTLMQRPPGQSSLLLQLLCPAQGPSAAQKQSPFTSSEQKQASPQGVVPSKHVAQGEQPGLCAYARVVMLVRIGADQATAAPAPIRLSILLRETPSSGRSM